MEDTPIIKDLVTLLVSAVPSDRPVDSLRVTPGRRWHQNSMLVSAQDGVPFPSSVIPRCRIGTIAKWDNPAIVVVPSDAMEFTRVVVVLQHGVPFVRRQRDALVTARMPGQLDPAEKLVRGGISFSRTLAAWKPSTRRELPPSDEASPGRGPSDPGRGGGASCGQEMESLQAGRGR